MTLISFQHEMKNAVRRLSRIPIGVFLIAWAIGFAKYLGVTIWTNQTINGVSYAFGSTPFPIWPNILDVLGLAICGCYLILDGVMKS